MIFDSDLWKRNLLSTSKKLDKHRAFTCWNEIEYFRFEKLIMVAFYSIRKLRESGKLSNSTTSSKIAITQFPTKGKVVHFYNAHNYLEYYDFESPLIVKKDLAFCSNQVIHSYVFSPCFYFNDQGEQNLKGIHFNSDDNRNICVYEMSIESLIKSFSTTGKDYPAYAGINYDEKIKDYRIFTSNSEPVNVSNVSMTRTTNTHYLRHDYRIKSLKLTIPISLTVYSHFFVI